MSSPPQLRGAPSVAVGSTTIAGLVTAVVAAVLAVLSFDAGAAIEDQVTTIVAGVGSLVTLVTVLAGRYRQAIALIEGQATVDAAAAYGPTLTSTHIAGQLGTTTELTSEPIKPLDPIEPAGQEGGPS